MQLLYNYHEETRYYIRVLHIICVLWVFYAILICISMVLLFVII